jgi:hypothetical protein
MVLIEVEKVMMVVIEGLEVRADVCISCGEDNAAQANVQIGL